MIPVASRSTHKWICTLPVRTITKFSDINVCKLGHNKQTFHIEHRRKEISSSSSPSCRLIVLLCRKKRTNDQYLFWRTPFFPIKWQTAVNEYTSPLDELTWLERQKCRFLLMKDRPMYTQAKASHEKKKSEGRKEKNRWFKIAERSPSKTILTVNRSARVASSFRSWCAANT